MVGEILAAFIDMLLFLAHRFGPEALLDWKAWALMAGAWTAMWRMVNLLAVVGAGAVRPVRTGPTRGAPGAGPTRRG
jgi:hypothetical protein